MINLTKNQKENLDYILADTKFSHVNKNGTLIYFSNDSGSVNESELQAHLDNFDLLIPARLKAIKRITAQSVQAASAIKDNYPQYEIDTWAYQRRDADAYQLDPLAATSDIDMIALAKNKDRITQIQRTVEKVSDYREFIYNIIGKKQNLVDDIKTSIDLDYINSINFED